MPKYNCSFRGDEKGNAFSMMKVKVDVPDAVKTDRKLNNTVHGAISALAAFAPLSPALQAGPNPPDA